MMDFFAELGPLAIVTRLRRLTERLAQDAAAIYKEQNIDFEPRWFPVFYLLSRKAPLSIVEIAQLLDISHPAVNQIAGELVAKGLVCSRRDPADGRKRLLALTAKGQALLPALDEIWNGIHDAVADLLNETGADVLGVVAELETVQARNSIRERFLAARKRKQLAEVDVIEFDPAYRDRFKTLNEEWIRKYFSVEPEDEKVLGNPEAEILAKSGVILFARSMNGDGGAEEEILGTCALVNKGDGLYELSKMAVTEKAQGRQIGKKLLVASIEKARRLNADAVMLETNSRLTAAVSLYRKLGFRLVPIEPGNESKYARTDMRMRLEL